MANITQNCVHCGKPFLIIEMEQKFLQNKNLPFPQNCPTCRQLRRLNLRGGARQLFKTKCQKCGQDIVVSYDPSKTTNQILCKQDYQQWFSENDAIIKEPLPEV